MLPRMIVDLKKIGRNVEKLVDLLGSRNIEMVGVTKLFMGRVEIAEIFRKNGVELLADSRLENIKRMIDGGIRSPFMMIRIPQMSRLEELVESVDYALVSEPEIVKILNDISPKVLRLFYMVDVGDLREGVMYDRAVEEIGPLLNMERARIVGLGTNVGCFGGVLPSEENLKILVKLADELELEEISVGGTVYLMALERGILPERVSQMRIGEAALLGTDATGDRDIEYLEQGTVILETEVLEIKWKPSVPIGPRGKDAMGRMPEFEDMGIRLRAIVAVGEQDVDPRGMKPLDPGVRVVHASSDHLIVDITDAEKNVSVGNVLAFRLNYSATLRAMTSPYVEKIFLG